jgi:alpha-amylase/alpha-mannosidase (GH57 family)
MQHIKINKILLHEKFGFRPKSTYNASYNLINDILKAFNNNG